MRRLNRQISGGGLGQRLIGIDVVSRRNERAEPIPRASRHVASAGALGLAVSPTPLAALFVAVALGAGLGVWSHRRRDYGRTQWQVS